MPIKSGQNVSYLSTASRDSFLPLGLTASRAAIRSTPRGREVVMSVPAPRKRKRLPCRFSLHHKWVRHKNPEGEDYP